MNGMIFLKYLNIKKKGHLLSYRDFDMSYMY